MTKCQLAIELKSIIIFNELMILGYLRLSFAGVIRLIKLLNSFFSNDW